MFGYFYQHKNMNQIYMYIKGTKTNFLPHLPMENLPAMKQINPY